MLGAFALITLMAIPAVGQNAPSDASFFDRAWRIAGTLLDEESPYYIRFGGITTGAGLSVGPGVRLKGLAGGRLDFNAVTIVSHRMYLLAETSVTTPVPGLDALRAGAFARRKYFPQEDYFGLGPGSQRDNRVSYSYDETAAGLLATLRASPLTIEGRVEYRHPDVGHGHDDSIPSIEARFSDSSAPGLLLQPDYVVGIGSVIYEGATPVGHPRQGGRYEASLSRFWGRQTNTYDFLRFDADLRQYLPVVPDRHLVVLRALTTLSGVPEYAEMPFYYMPRLGGTSTLRGFRGLRFHDRNVLLFQAEYRWLPLRFVETAVFYDRGSVAPRVSDLAREHMMSDYGVGVRFGTDQAVFFRVEAAFGSRDGTRIYAKFSGAF